MEAVLVLLLGVLAAVAPAELRVEQEKSFEALVEWVRELGGGVEGIRFQSIPGMGIGAVATEDLEEGAAVSWTPFSAIINIEHVLVSELFGALSEELPQLSNVNLKGLFLAYERKLGREMEGEEGGMVEEAESEGEKEEGDVREEEEKDEGVREMDEVQNTDGGQATKVQVEEGERDGREPKENKKSFWQPYLDILPNVVHTTHVFSEQELELLQTSMVKEFAIMQQNAAREAYATVAEVIDVSFPELKDLTLGDLQWGVSTWSSRAHLVRVKDSQEEWQTASCLVPVADMYNMAARREDVNVMCNTNKDSTHFECYTTTAIPAGRQLLAEYIIRNHKRHNGRLLLHYGFVIPNNPLDSVSIELPEVTRDLPHYKDRQALARKLSVLKQSFLQLTRPSVPEPTVNELLQVLRVTLGSVPELQRASQLPSPFSQPLGPSSEQRVLKKAVDFIRNILSSYPTTLEQDTHILLSEQLSPNSQLAVLQRREEKAVLTANMAHLISLVAQAAPDNKTQHRKTEL